MLLLTRFPCRPWAPRRRSLAKMVSFFTSLPSLSAALRRASSLSPGNGGSLCGPDLLLGSDAAYRRLIAALCLLTLAAASITFTLPAAAAGLTPAPPLPPLPSLNVGGQGHLPFWANVAAFVAVDNTKSRICGAEVSRAGTRVFEVYWVLGCD